MPIKPGRNKPIKPVPECTDACCAFKNLRASIKMTGGVKMTARAKLKSSAFFFSIPKISPVDIVAPERENPRKGRQIPCTIPIKHAAFNPNAEISFDGPLFLNPVQSINAPTAASEAAINSKLPKSCSISAWAAPFNIVFSIKIFNMIPTKAVARVAVIINRPDSRKTLPDEKKFACHELQKKTMTASMVPV